MKLAVLFSGGKDSTYSIYKARQDDHQIKCLVTLFPKSPDSQLLHFPNVELTKFQSKTMKIPQIITELNSNEAVEEMNALKASLREAPDVILVGEIRARETMEAALELSNTGHLALSTLHANNAGQAIERVINMFPQSMRKQLLLDLSLNVRGIISQRLVKSKDGKRCAALEILVMTPHIQDLILKGDIEEIKVAMEESGKEGMQTFDTALYNLYKEERIELEEALNNASSRTNLEAKINFG